MITIERISYAAQQCQVLSSEGYSGLQNLEWFMLELYVRVY